MLLPTTSALAALLSTALVHPAAAAGPPSNSSAEYDALAAVPHLYAVQHQLAKDSRSLGVGQPVVSSGPGGARRRRRRVGAKREPSQAKVRGVSESRLARVGGSESGQFHSADEFGL